MQVATPAEVYEAPNSKFVADFIGNVNMFEGTAAAVANGKVDIAVAPENLTIRTDAASKSCTIGQPVGFAIRPEKIRVSRKQPADPSINSAHGELYDIAYFGDMTVFHVKLESGRIIKAASLNAVRTVEDPLGYDDMVWVNFDADAGIVLTA
jgi:putrescine transport system ATP-binding protein